jgi:hypothetical protein
VGSIKSSWFLITVQVKSWSIADTWETAKISLVISVWNLVDIFGEISFLAKVNQFESMELRTEFERQRPLNSLTFLSRCRFSRNHCFSHWRRLSTMTIEPDARLQTIEQSTFGNSTPVSPRSLKGCVSKAGLGQNRSNEVLKLKLLTRLFRPSSCPSLVKVHRSCTEFPRHQTESPVDWLDALPDLTC